MAADLVIGATAEKRAGEPMPGRVRLPECRSESGFLVRPTTARRKKEEMSSKNGLLALPIC